MATSKILTNAFKELIYQDWLTKEHIKYLDINSNPVYNYPITQEKVMGNKQAEFIRLENKTGGHNKYWELKAINADEAEATWGAIGKASGGTKVYTNEQAEKLIKEKIKKGYKVVDMR